MVNITNHQGNATQNHNETSPPHVRMTTIKNNRNNMCWWGCGEKGTLVRCWQECKYYHTNQESHLWVYIQVRWNENRISKRCLHSHVHCSIIHNNQDVGTNLVSISGWMDKEYIYIWILFSHNKKEILQFATTWMKLEGIMLNEISQTEKDKYCMISLVSGI